MLRDGDGLFLAIAMEGIAGRTASFLRSCFAGRAFVSATQRHTTLQVSAEAATPEEINQWTGQNDSLRAILDKKGPSII